MISSLSYHFVPFFSDLQGYTALHYAAVGGYTHTMHVLLGTKKTLVDMADKEQVGGGGGMRGEHCFFQKNFCNRF